MRRAPCPRTGLGRPECSCPPCTLEQVLAHATAVVVGRACADLARQVGLGERVARSCLRERAR